MLRKSVTFIISMLTLTMYASNFSDSSPTVTKVEKSQVTAPSTTIVVNEKMIARFNAIDYSDDNFSINSLLASCNFEQIKEIRHAHNLQTVNINSKKEIQKILLDEELIVY